ncbi:hypothetical protein BH18THE2_BH18THE2_34180 [soil metagenome]
MAVTLRKIGISPGECAIGCRVAKMMNRLGVSSDHFQSFLADVNKCSIDLGLPPQKIASYIRDLLEFSNTSVLSQIPAYLEQKKREKKQLEKEVKELKVNTEILRLQKTDMENMHYMALEDHKITRQQLKWYSGIKEELVKYGIPVEDVSQLANVIENVRALGYDPVQIRNEISNLQLVRSQYIFYRNGIPALKNQLVGLNQTRSALEQMIQTHNQTLSVHNELELLGFGLKELNLLCDTVREISIANNVPENNAVEKFLKDIEDNYDNRLGFEAKVENLRLEITILAQQLTGLRLQLSLHPLIGPTFLRLIQNGVEEEEIKSFADLVKTHSNLREDSTKTWQSLIDDIRKYGDIKLANNHVSEQLNNLRKEVFSLQAEFGPSVD